MKLRLFTYSTVLCCLPLCSGCGSLIPAGSFVSIWILLAFALLMAVFASAMFPDALRFRWLRNIKDVADTRFNEQNITHTFIASIPTLTREMNLEVTSSKQTEVLERSDSKKLLGVDLGTNAVRLQVPVTYRYHVRLYDSWTLRISGTTLLVTAPAIRCGLPPAIHTDEIQQSTTRGWARCSPAKMLDQLHRELTPVLSQYATDSRRIDLVRETCRQSVAEFVRKWLHGEERWRPGKFTAIHVRFANETAMPSNPTVQLLGFQQ